MALYSVVAPENVTLCLDVRQLSFAILCIASSIELLGVIDSVNMIINIYIQTNQWPCTVYLSKSSPSVYIKLCEANLNKTTCYNLTYQIF